MQDKRSDEFDLRLRSMLEDAEARPPRRVWRSISARLDAAAAPATAPGGLRWAGLSFAAAAAVAAGIFFSGTRNSIPTIIHNQEQALLAQEAGEAAVVAPAQAGMTTAAPVRNAAAPDIRPKTGTAADAAEAARPEAPADTQAAAEHTAPEAGPKPETAKPAAAKPERRTAAVADPFADPAPAAKRRAVRPGASLYAQGSIGSNDSDFRSAPVSMMAPGQPGGFSELGSPTYRIPFTLGLGVRFYLTPRLALGTGLDYSLLTRTFTGSCDGVSGTVNHSLQYLGVPLDLSYDILSYDKVRLYVYGGGEAEWCLSNKYRLFASPDIVRSYPVNRPQFSVSGGLGVEFRLSRTLGLYLDPGIGYYFPGGQPRSIRTDQPLQLRFDAGLRFNLGTQKP